MADAAVRIARLSTCCDLVAHIERGEVLARALTHGLAQRLPGALADELGTDLDGPDAVIRLDSIELATVLGTRADPAELARAVARKISAAIRQALRGEDQGVRVWPDRQAYLASYILHRLGIRPEPDWAFGEFAKLDHLPAERATAELIAAQPDLFRALSSLDATNGLPARLVERLEADQWSALLDTIMAGHRPSEPTPTTLIASLRAVAALRPRYDPEREPARATVSLLLDALPGTAPDLPVLALLVASAWHITRLRRSVEATGENGGFSQRKDGEGVSPERSSQSVSPSRLPRFLQRAIRRVAQAGIATDALGLAEPVPRSNTEAPLRPGGDAAPSPKRRGESGIEPERTGVTTPFAGLALLSPCITALSLFHYLSPEALALAVWQTLPEAHFKAASEDAALATLFPVDPRALAEVEFPSEIPDLLLNRLHPDSRATFEAGARRAQWSALILAAFATRLTGLQASSVPYLQEQFLLREGRVNAAGAQIEVTLGSMPLAIILQMAGLTGTSWLAPHLGRRSILITVERGV